MPAKLRLERARKDWGRRKSGGKVAFCATLWTLARRAISNEINRLDDPALSYTHS